MKVSMKNQKVSNESKKCDQVAAALRRRVDRVTAATDISTLLVCDCAWTAFGDARIRVQTTARELALAVRLH